MLERFKSKNYCCSSGIFTSAYLNMKQETRSRIHSINMIKLQINFLFNNLDGIFFLIILRTFIVPSTCFPLPPFILVHTLPACTVKRVPFKLCLAFVHFSFHPLCYHFAESYCEQPKLPHQLALIQLPNYSSSTLYPFPALPHTFNGNSETWGC
jgi:hypothetical protein